jgi:hypothetical protein
MDQKKINAFTAELAMRLENRQKFGAPITNEYIATVISSVIKELEELPDFKLSDQEIEGMKFKLGSMFNIKIGEAAITLNNPDIPRWFEAKKTDINWNYWDAYRQMLVSQARSQDVVKENELVINKVLDFSGDPTSAGPWARKGLVMGNVQSGKTQNYLGLINKAIDAGYKVIILLGGHLNDLRNQTQERVDSGVVGRVSRHLLSARAGGPERIGVGRFRDPSRNVHTFTTTEGDFSGNFANSLGVNLTGLSEPAIFTVKKQTKVLENLYEWIKDHHLLDPETGKTLDLPMLLIDDEADYASVNTKSHIDEVTKTNELIRKLLKLFNRNTYVGYTATPFANIFIDPETETDPETGYETINDDLFPSDFMVKIPVPEDYVGQEYFFGQSTRGTVVINDCSDLQNLRSQSDINVIPDSLKEAVRVFLLNVCIRTTRGNPHEHNTMMVNISHLKKHQDRVANLINQYREILLDAIDAFSGLGIENSRDNSTMASIENTFLEKFSGDENYNEIFSELPKAINKIKAFSVNQGGKTLDYSLYEEWGLSVIIVGGHKLSRGLTLEGLSVSYFTRNSKAYDTLMQMCRWFGYRPGYKDLCRVYLPFESLNWYSFITLAIAEIYGELQLMSNSEKRPSEFGLKVRDHPGAMVITAKNKMSTAESIIRSQDLWGQILRRFKFRKPYEINLKNLETTNNFISHIMDNQEIHTKYDNQSNSVIFEEVTYESVIKYLNDMDLPEDDIGNDALVRQLTQMQKSGVRKPHVCIMNQNRSGNRKWVKKLSPEEQIFIESKISLAELKNITLFGRAMKDDGVNFKTQSVQLGNSDDERLFLSEPERASIKTTKPNAVSFDYIASKERDFAGLIIYPFAIGIKTPYTTTDDNYTARLGHGLNPTIGFTISIPRPEHLRGLSSNELKNLVRDTRHSYQINKVYQEQLAKLDMIECDEDE